MIIYQLKLKLRVDWSSSKLVEGNLFEVLLEATKTSLLGHFKACWVLFILWKLNLWNEFYLNNNKKFILQGKYYFPQGKKQKMGPIFVSHLSPWWPRGDISDQCPLSIIYINMCLLFENEHVGAKQENTKRKEKTKKMKRKKPNNFDVSNESFFNCEFVIPHLKLSIGTFSHKQTNKLWPHNELGPRTKFAIVIMFCMSGLPFW